MAEKICEVRMFELNFYCETKECEGVMLFTHEPPLATGNRPLFKHACVKCRDVKYLPGQYPMTMGLPINKPIPEAWIPKLDRENVNNPPDEKKIVLS